MKTLTGACIFTHDVPRLRAFYRDLLGIDPSDEGPEMCAFIAPGAVLSILSAEQMERLAAGSTGGRCGGGFSLEFSVDDPDAEFARLPGLCARVLKPPTTYPWGRRAVWFLDPDGNMVSFYCTASSEEGEQ